MKSDRIKIFGVLNHLGNQYEMLKLAKKYPVKFCYLENNVRRWSRFSARPEPTTWLSEDEFEWVDRYTPGEYDVAILHLDQQASDPLIGKGQVYRQLDEVIQDIPKIVVNHGTPMWDEFFTEDIVINGGLAQTQRGTREIDGIRKLVGNNYMIVNSYEAVNRWGGLENFPGGIHPLIHGMDPNEWWDLPKEPRVILSLSPGGLDKYYNRSLITAIKSEVKDRTGLDVIHFNVNMSFDNDNWYQYRDFTARSLIAINPFKDSPMPRARSEQLLSGCCVLSSRHHNADEFIDHGVNGFIVPDNPQSYAEAIHLLINEGYREAVDMGQRGKDMAKQYFNLDRYHADLFYLVKEIVNGNKPVWDGMKVWDDKERKNVKDS